MDQRLSKSRPKNPPLKLRPELLRKHKIQILPGPEGDTPHEEWFEQIETIGSIRFRDYSTKAELEATAKPWRATICSQADKIAHIASEAAEDGGCMEATWRTRLEHHIFSRFENEVTWCVKPGHLVGY